MAPRTCCGTVKLGQWPESAIGEDTAVEVPFAEGLFDVPPSIVVQLAGIDAQSSMGTRVSTWASDVSRTGFRLHARTWGDSVTYAVTVSWVATSDFAVVQLGSCAVGRWPHQLKEHDEAVDFPASFACQPDVAVGLSLIDAQGGSNLRVRTEGSSVQCHKFTLGAASWGDSVTWSATSSWVASACPAALQIGSQELHGSDERIGSPEQMIDVKFPRAFAQPPDVVLCIAGIEADGSVPTRIETSADKVSSEGFQLHVRSWENSVTLRLRVSWIAVPRCKDDIAASKPVAMPAHHPPSDYVVEGPPLGTGWWGVTHRARHVGDGRTYAIKTCKHSFRQNEESLRQELSNLAMLPTHPNLLRYHGCILQADQLHIVTEYLDAFKLADLVPIEEGPYPHRHCPMTVLRWICQTYDALAHMHRAKMVHRDLHGDNILVEKDVNGDPSQGPRAIRIIDFGVAKVYDVMRPRQMSGGAGCFQYFSPERRRGHDFDDRDDVWAVGCHLTELCTGRLISRRPGCGVDGIDFALEPSCVAQAVADVEDGRCRQLADAVLVRDMERRPGAAAARDLIHSDLLMFVPGKRSASALRTAGGKENRDGDSPIKGRGVIRCVASGKRQRGATTTAATRATARQPRRS
eukprot:TRINITY_DN121579_c0_g1_i1.p1 TRINITY_DN121579_c0_g1~~TRINITY_DN121579_c0_g1_i1.p1  ORF type:complete len:686 (+),score=99.23 TRINITY_DN121579_c0_g1_i1:161-2059(+)